MAIGAGCGAATGPIPAEARHQEGLRLERPGASSPTGLQAVALLCAQRNVAQRPGRCHGRSSPRDVRDELERTGTSG
jgi:hypothetical protein